jgi:hypothetical protein
MARTSREIPEAHRQIASRFEELYAPRASRKMVYARRNAPEQFFAEIHAPKPLIGDARIEVGCTNHYLASPEAIVERAETMITIRDKLGDRYALQQSDPDFDELFRYKADFRVRKEADLRATLEALALVVPWQKGSSEIPFDPNHFEQPERFDKGVSSHDSGVTQQIIEQHVAFISQYPSSATFHILGYYPCSYDLKGMPEGTSLSVSNDGFKPKVELGFNYSPIHVFRYTPENLRDWGANYIRMRDAIEARGHGLSKVTHYAGFRMFQEHKFNFTDKFREFLDDLVDARDCARSCATTEPQGKQEVLT